MVLLATSPAVTKICTCLLYTSFIEAGYIPVIAATSARPLHLVIHDFEPGWDTYVEREKGYYVVADIGFDDVKESEYHAVLCIGGRAPE